MVNELIVDIDKENSHTDSQPIVSICCITFNHEKFIRDAIEGFLMQKTDFPIEIIIRDDASTDATAEIVRDYQSKHPEIIHTIMHTENQYTLGKRAFPEVFKMARGKYIALCEGDDYWTDPLKLQKQVDFMESHPECSISCHRVLYKYENAEEKNHLFPDIENNKIYDKDEFYGKYFSATNSIMFKNINISNLVKFLDGFIVGDLPLYYFYIQLGNFGYLSEVMGVYRRHDQSIWFPRDDFYKDLGLLDTYVKIKTRLSIRGSNHLDKTILNLGLKTLAVNYQNKNYKGMRKTLRRTANTVFSASKRQRKKYFRYYLLAHFPGLPQLKHILVKE